MKFKKISTKMLLVLLSISIISMALMSFVSYYNSKKIIQFQIQKNMDFELKLQINNIQTETQRVSIIASQIAKNVGSTYMSTSLTQYEEMLGKMIYDSDMTLGSGIWFEPYVYDKNEQYVGPYVYKEGDKAVSTYEYSNSEYNYFNYDWYKAAKGGSRKPVFSELYYDETLKATMTTCSVPMYDKYDTFIGVITVDIEISKIQDLINHLRIGIDGKAYLFSKEGIYITHEDSEKVMKENIVDSENKSLSSLGKDMISNQNGTKNFEIDHIKYTGYYSTVSDLGWKIMVRIPQAEVNKPLNDLLTQLVSISIISLLLLVVAIILLVRYLQNSVKKVKDFALSLSNGDFSISQLEIKSKDELGQMGDAMNKMLSENKTIIKTITKDADEVNNISEELSETSVKLINNFVKIEDATKQINEDMMNSSAATEEVNASVEEVNASVNTLAEETSKSYDMVTAIKDRAFNIEKKSKDSYELATKLAIMNENNLNQSMEDAKVVKSIGDMANAISQIAEQVNLLSLNAAIEAARAGEQGRGFAVVANEIGSLANQTTSTVDDIKQTISKVQVAFSNLMKNSQQLLSFIKDTVTPDYMTFVNGANLYRQDADDIEVNVNKIAKMTENIEKIINEVGEAIQNIAEVSQNTVVNSSTIISNMDMVSCLIENISDKVTNQKEISNSLNEMVKKFIV